MPKKHAKAICEEIIDRNLNIQWSTGGLKPVAITDDLGVRNHKPSSEKFTTFNKLRH